MLISPATPERNTDLVASDSCSPAWLAYSLRAALRIETTLPNLKRSLKNEASMVAMPDRSFGRRTYNERNGSEEQLAVDPWNKR